MSTGLGDYCASTNSIRPFYSYDRAAVVRGQTRRMCGSSSMMIAMVICPPAANAGRRGRTR
eukprot:12132-Prymnesium_polylepis.1